MHLFRRFAGFGAPSRFCGAVTLHSSADSNGGGGSATATAAAAATAARRAALAPAGPSLQSLKRLSPPAPGSEREAGAQLFSARIGPEGADVTRLLGALLGGDDAPLQLRSNFPNSPNNCQIPSSSGTTSRKMIDVGNMMERSGKSQDHGIAWWQSQK
ncbi:uncharacterized protein LOC144616583 [Panthera onca]